MHARQLGTLLQQSVEVPRTGCSPARAGGIPAPGGARRSLLLSRARRSFWDPHGHLLRQSLLGHSTLRDRRTRQVPADGRFALSVVRMAGAPSLCAWNADSWRSSSRSLKREASHRRPAASGSLNRRFPMRSGCWRRSWRLRSSSGWAGAFVDSGRGGPGGAGAADDAVLLPRQRRRSWTVRGRLRSRHCRVQHAVGRRAARSDRGGVPPTAALGPVRRPGSGGALRRAHARSVR